ncbi:MAG TPA: hypothetical protein VMD97_08620 [Candidatus Aquilonibacter sp.]|nr:hypothetical protein [Candidatus Aquilonibacter sp.]
MPRLSRAALPIALLGCAALVDAQTGGPAGFPAKIGDPPQTMPDGCPTTTVAELAKTDGTPVYKSVHREIAALRFGHVASQKLQAAVSLRSNTMGGGSLHQVVQVMSGMDAAQRMYLCASFVVAQGGGDAAVDRILREQIVPVLNKMTLQAWRLENTVVMRNSSAAEPPSAILEDRKQADVELLDAVKQTGAFLVGRDSLQVTCSEKHGLMAELTALSKSTEADEFTSAAQLLEVFLEQPLPCKIPDGARR